MRELVNIKFTYYYRYVTVEKKKNALKTPKNELKKNTHIK